MVISEDVEINSKREDHESANEHLENLEKWKYLKTRLKLHTTIDDAGLQSIETEKQKWKGILSRLLDATLWLNKM